MLIKIWGIIRLFFHWHFYRQMLIKIREIIRLLFQPDFYRREPVKKILMNFAIGLSITMILMLLRDYPLLMDIEDQSMDMVMELRKGQIPAASEKNIPPFVFLDIDDESQRQWNQDDETLQPFFTPRNHLQNLIKTAVDAKASLVIVDVDLSRKTPIHESSPVKNRLHQHDWELSQYLKEYAANCKDKDNVPACPPIILARTLQSPEMPPTNTDILETLANTFSIPNEPIRHPSSSFLDDILEPNAPHVQWASVAFIFPSDQVVRRWWLWQPICVEQQPQFIPSVELVAATLFRVRDTTTPIPMALNPQTTQETLNNALIPEIQIQPENCQKGIYVPQVRTKEVEIVKDYLTVKEGLRGIHQRIVYSMPWKPHQHETGNERYRIRDEEGKTLLTVIPVHTFLANPFLAETLEDRIVVIGGSYDYNNSGGDIHLTPIGEMPGGLVIINAIHSLLQHEDIDFLEGWKKLILTALLILVMSLFFSIFHSVWGTILSGLFIIILLIPASICLLHYGIWLDFVLPLLAVQYHQIVVDIHNMNNMTPKRVKFFVDK